MIRQLLRRLIGRYCRKHRVTYSSDFCPQCMKAMVVRLETRDVVTR